jgi:hypothetical protein
MSPEKRCVRVLEVAREKLVQKAQPTICDAVQAACREVGATKKEELATLFMAGTVLAEFDHEEAGRLREMGAAIGLRRPRL